MEGEGSSEMQFVEIETNAGCLDSSVIFHVINDVAGFVLYMHEQIPSILQDISLEFDALQNEFKELDMDLRQSELKPTSRRMNLSRKRVIKQGIRRMEKLMNTVSSLQNALQLLISETPNVQEVIFVLGASPIRPQHIYQLYFSHGKSESRGEPDFSKGKAAEGLSRKAIRTLISKGAGSDSYPGPTKLFLLVKASSSLSMPQHFIPKRDFRYGNKIVPFRLRFKCKMEEKVMDAPNLRDYTSDDLI